MIYIALLLLLIYLSYRYDYRKFEKNRKVWIIFVLLIFISLAGFRYRIGGDTVTYMYIYEKLNPIMRLNENDFIETRFAAGFLLLASLFKTFTDDFTVLQIFHSTVVCCVVFWFLYKNCRNYFFALIVFYIFLYPLFMFQQMRESLAVSIFLLAWPAFRDGKWLYWYLASVCAFMFHISSVMMFILPLFCMPGIRQLFIFGSRTWFICILVFLLGMLIQNLFFKYIEIIAVFESIAERAQTYSKDELSGSIFTIGGVIGMIIKSILYPIIALILSQRDKKKETGRYINEFNKKELMALMSIYVSIFTICVAIVSRYNNYFFVFAIIYLSDMAFSKLALMGRFFHFKFLYWLVFFLPMFGFQIYGTYFGNVNKSGTLKTYMMYHPYSSYFDKEKDKDREALYRYKRLKSR